MYPFAGPAEVRGYFQKIRDPLQALLVLLFMLMPWLKINGLPVLLFDVMNRHFVFFGFPFFSHDAPLLFFLLILFILGIFTVTALFGRLWCGWTCPQTVFLHAVFNKIEKLILGKNTDRKLFYRSAGSMQKNFKLLLLYSVYLLTSWMLAHSLVAYFLGAGTVTLYIREGPLAHMNAFLLLVVMTLGLFLNFTFLREKFCFIICPYGRFQNALIDTNSLVVFYDFLRGETRGKIGAGSTPDQGDCVDCHRCVSVCPTKIDIRNGFQLECIACGKCIDACNAVMRKLQRQPNLIRYETGDQKKITFKRFRLALYVSLIGVFMAGLVLTLRDRAALEFSVTRESGMPFSSRLDSTGKILINQFKLQIQNQRSGTINLGLELSEQNMRDGYRLLTPASQLSLSGQKSLQVPAFIEVRQSAFNKANRKMELLLKSDGVLIRKQIQFVEVE